MASEGGGNSSSDSNSIPLTTDSNSIQPVNDSNSFPPTTDSISIPPSSDSSSAPPSTDSNSAPPSTDSNSIPPTRMDRTRRLSMLLPLLVSLASQTQNQQQESASASDSGVGFRVLMVNGRTGVVLLLEGTGDVDTLLEHLSSKSGVSPASKASIEAMPRVVINEEDAECAICLDTYEVGSVAREMPCKHRFHSECIEKWLGIHGTCPICRFVMPAEEKRENGGEGGRGGREDGGERREPAFTVRMWMRTRSSASSNSTDVISDSGSESGDGSTSTTDLD